MADQTTARRDDLKQSLISLKDSGISFRGPFLTSKGELVLVEDQILKVAELVELFSSGQLTRERIRNFLSSGGHP